MKEGVIRILVIFQDRPVSVTSMDSSCLYLLNDMAEHTFMLKNNKSLIFLRWAYVQPHQRKALVEIF